MAHFREDTHCLNQRLKVLIVDDESSQRTGLAAMVSAWGMTPETAGEGNEALQKLEEFAADVIFTDLNMPGLDGFGFLQRLREAGRHAPHDRAHGLRQHRNRREDGSRTGSLLVPGKADSASHAGSADPPRRLACRAARREARAWSATSVYKGSMGEMVGTGAAHAGDFRALAAGRTRARPAC